MWGADPRGGAKGKRSSSVETNTHFLAGEAETQIGPDPVQRGPSADPRPEWAQVLSTAVPPLTASQGGFSHRWQGSLNVIERSGARDWIVALTKLPVTPRLLRRTPQGRPKRPRAMISGSLDLAEVTVTRSTPFTRQVLQVEGPA